MLRVSELALQVFGLSLVLLTTLYVLVRTPTQNLSAIEFGIGILTISVLALYPELRRYLSKPAGTKTTSQDER